MEQLESIVFDIVHEFALLLQKKPLETYVDGKKIYHPHYRETGITFDTMPAHSVSRITAENLDNLAQLSAFNRLERYIQNGENSIPNSKALLNIVRGLLIRVINRLDPTTVDIPKIRYYLPFLKEELQLDEPLLQTKSILFPLRSDIDRLNLSCGIVVRRLFPDEYDQEWFNIQSERTFVDGGPRVAEYLYERTFPQHDLRARIETTGIPIYPTLRFIESLRIFTASSVGYGKLSYEGGLFRTNLVPTPEMTPELRFSHFPGVRAGSLSSTETQDFKEFWTRFSIHQLDYLETASRLFTKAMSTTDPEIRFLLLVITLEALFRDTEKKIEDSLRLYARMRKLLKVIGWKNKASKKSLDKISHVRNHFVHYGRTPPSGNHNGHVVIPDYSWIAEVSRLVSDCMKGVVGLGPLEKRDLLQQIDGSENKDIAAQLPTWCLRSDAT